MDARKIFHSKWPAILLGLGLVVSLSLSAPLARADNPAGLGFLELDGNVVPGDCNSTSSCTGGTSTCASPLSSTSTTDWSCLFSQTSIFTGSGSPTAAQIAAAYVSKGLPANAVVSSFVPDGYSGGPLCPTAAGTSCPDPTTYTSGSKDILDVSSNTCASSNNLLAKDNLINTYGIKYINPSNGHQIVYIGDEKQSNGGDNNIGVWFDQNSITVPSPCPGGNGTPFVGSHAVGDILTVSNFTKGGILAGIHAFVWNGTSGTCTGKVNGIQVSGSAPLCNLLSGNVCGSTSVDICGIVSHATTNQPTGTICGFSWVTQSKELSPSMNNTLSGEHCTAVNSFYEMGIDLSALGFTSCKTTAIPETRSSQQTTATIFDFTILNLNSCATHTSTLSSQTGTVGPGSSVTDTATVTSVAGGGTPTGSVQFYLCFNGTSATSCDVTVASNKFGASQPLSSGGTATSKAVNSTSTPITNNAAGFYCWSAVYTPTGGFQGSQNTITTNECFHVVVATTTVTQANNTGSNVIPGTPVSDNATVTDVAPGTGTPTGSVQFFFCGPSTVATSCSTSGSPTDTEALSTLTSTSARATSAAQSPTQPGFYCWSAVYVPATGSSFKASNSTTTTNECFHVSQSIPKISAFGYTNTPTNNDPTTGSGTVVYSVNITNYATTPVTLFGNLSVSGQTGPGTGTATVTCTGGNTLQLSGSVAAGASKTFSLSCTYSDSGNGDTVTAVLKAYFTDISQPSQAPVSGSPATSIFTIQKT